MKMINLLLFGFLIIILSVFFVQAITLTYTNPTDANATFFTKNYTFVNFTSNAQNVSSFIFNWNGTNITVDDDSLVLQYHFNNGTSFGENDNQFVDVSRNGNNGTCWSGISGGSTRCEYNSSDKMFGGYSSWFNGGVSSGNGNGIRINFTQKIKITSDKLTIMFWMKTPGIASVGDKGIITKGTPGGDSEFAVTHSGGPTDRLSFGIATGLGNSFIVNSAKIFNDDIWHFIVARYNSSALEIFVDGLLDGSASASGNIRDVGNHISIGCRQDSNCGSNHLFYGNLDEIRLYNRSVSNAEWNASRYMECSRFYCNVTNLISGNYTYYGYINDSNGDWINTSIRNYGGGQIDTAVVNISASIIINQPSNNSQTHNSTPAINFTITAGNHNNISFAVWLDQNPNPINMINSSNSTLQGNFSFAQTIITEVFGSINGTYFLKINGTDNATNIFTSIFSFNLTNNVSNYVPTNVTITPLPLSVGNLATGYCNITSKSSEENNQSMTNRLWYVNRIQLTTNINSTTLAGTNVTLNANITFSCRINNGYGETAWTNFTNSSIINVGDTTAPQILNLSIENTALTNIFRFSCADASSNLKQMNFTLRFNGTTVNHTRILDISQLQTQSIGTQTQSYISQSIGTQTQSYIWNYSIFKTDETSLVGLWNITEVGCSDTSNNNIRNITTENLNFTVTSPPVGGSTTAGGGGGGGGGLLQTIIINKTINVTIPNCNFNSKCEGKNGEDPFGCPFDCKLNLNYLFCDDPSQKCIKNIFDFQNKTFRFVTSLAVLSLIYLGLSDIGKKS